MRKFTLRCILRKVVSKEVTAGGRFDFFLGSVYLQTSFRLIDFPHCLCTTIPKLVNCFPAEMCGDILLGEGGVL